MKDNHRILVIGGGYTGMMCAIRLARRTRRLGVAVTLINPSARFIERLRMHQIATGQQLGDFQIPELLAGTGVTFRQAKVTRIDVEARQVALDDGGTLGYDNLVYALGSVTDTAVVPGADTHADTLSDAGTAHRFATRLAGLGQDSAVTVCGGGLTGVEAATEIAESHPELRVTLISRDVPGAMMGERARAYLHRAMERLGVTLRVGTAVTKVLPGAVELEGGELVSSDACLWTTGVRVSPLAADAGIVTDERGRIVVDATLRSVSNPEIRAIGDAAAIRQAWGEIHGTCQSGMPTGAYTADAIAKELRGKKVKPFRFGYFHQPLSIGRHDGVIQFTHVDDSPRRLYLKGRAAVLYKGFVTSSPVPTFRLSKYAYPSPYLSKGGRITRKTVV